MDAGYADTFTSAWAITKNGAAFASGTAGTFSFTPDDNGTYVVTLTVTDDDGGVGTDSKIISVTNVAPTVLMPSTFPNTVPNLPTSFDLGSVIDPGTDSPWTVDVNWGDGSSHTIYTVSGTHQLGAQTHTYTSVAFATPFAMTVTVTDKDGGVGTATSSVTVGTSVFVLNGTASGALTVSGNANISI